MRRGRTGAGCVGVLGGLIGAGLAGVAVGGDAAVVRLPVGDGALGAHADSEGTQVVGAVQQLGSLVACMG